MVYMMDFWFGYGEEAEENGAMNNMVDLYYGVIYSIELWSHLVGIKQIKFRKQRKQY